MTMQENIRDIVVFGAGGFGREVACIIKRINKIKPTWRFIGFFDDNASLIGTTNDYGTILGTSDDLAAWDKPLAVVIGIGSPKAVYSIANKIIRNTHLTYPNIIDPTVCVNDEDNYTLGQGNVIAANCFISIATKVGDFNTINNNTALGHDAVVGSYNSFMPSVNISGGVTIGDRNFFGVKSTILQYLKVGNDTTIGANALVTKDTEDGLLYIGIPAKAKSRH